MGKLKLGCMTTWAPESTMMLLGNGALQCFTVLMEVGKIGVIHNSRPNKTLKLYFVFLLLNLRSPCFCNVVKFSFSYHTVLLLNKYV